MSDLSRHPKRESDSEYFRARAERERNLASIAINDRARELHLQLAAEYETKAKDGIAND